MNTIIKDQNLKFIITPGYVTGLTQTDGSFSCGLTISADRNVSIIPNFTITTDLTSKYVLEGVQSFFGCGRININVEDHTANFVVSSRKLFMEIIISYASSF